MESHSAVLMTELSTVGDGAFALEVVSIALSDDGASLGDLGAVIGASVGPVARTHTTRGQMLAVVGLVESPTPDRLQDQNL
jgi:hypothetical protein